MQPQHQCMAYPAQNHTAFTQFNLHVIIHSVHKLISMNTVLVTMLHSMGAEAHMASILETLQQNPHSGHFQGVLDSSKTLHC